MVPIGAFSEGKRHLNEENGKNQSQRSTYIILIELIE
jgi:hypothetical protein